MGSVSSLLLSAGLVPGLGLLLVLLLVYANRRDFLAHAYASWGCFRSLPLQ